MGGAGAARRSVWAQSIALPWLVFLALLGLALQAQAASCTATDSATLSACVAGAGSGDTITLGSDVGVGTVPGNLNGGAKLALNGKTLTTPGTEWITSAEVSLQGGRLINTAGSSNLSSSALDFSDGAMSTVATAAGTTLTVASDVTFFNGATALFGSPSYTGTVLWNSTGVAMYLSSTPRLEVAGGTLVVGSSVAALSLADFASVTVTSGAALNVSSVTWASIKDLRGAGSLVWAGSTIQSGNFSGVISGSGGVSLPSGGNLLLSGANTFAGSLSVSGQLELNGSVASQTVVESGGTLQGTGTAAYVAVHSGGTLSPGSGGPGVFRTSAVDFDAGGSLALELNGVAVGTQYDQLVTSGDVYLDGATLNLSLGYTPAVGTVFTLVQNQGTQPVRGTFAGFPQGSVINLNGTLLLVSYVGGDGNDFTLTVPDVPVVSSATPGVGPVTGGTGITLTGQHFTAASSVTVGGIAATAVAVVSSTTITATTPAGAVGAQNVVVTTPGGTGTGLGFFTYVAAPVVTGVAPGNGPLTGGTAITITGSNLTGATAVTVDGVAVTGMAVVNATTITAITPAGTAGAKNVAVTTVGGTGTGAGLFTYVAAPVVTGVAPGNGPLAGGTAVTITGSNLTGATAVTVDGVAVTGMAVANATTITAATPAGSAGAKNVVVTTAGGSGTGVGLFTYVAAPVVTGVAPGNGPLAGGTAITITGSNLTGATAVTVGGVAVTGMAVVNATTITATTPAGTAGAKNVAVTTVGGTGAGAGFFTYLYPGSASGTLPGGTGVLGASVTSSPAGCGFSSAQFQAMAGAAASAPANLTFPYGMFSMTVGGSCGVAATATITLTFPGPIPAKAQFWKYGRTAANTTNHWYALTAASNDVQVAGNTMSYKVVDGGMGDDDLSANGVIVDPVALAVPLDPTGIPTLSQWALVCLSMLVMGLCVVGRGARMPSLGR